MARRDSCMKGVRNNRIVSLITAASAITAFIYCSSQLSDREEMLENPRNRRNFNFRTNSQTVDRLAQSSSPLQNTSETGNYGDTEGISPVNHGDTGNYGGTKSISPVNYGDYTGNYGDAKSISPVNYGDTRTYGDSKSISPANYGDTKSISPVNYGDTKSISPVIWPGNNPSTDHDGYENGHNSNHNHGENSVSENGQLETRYSDQVEEKEFKPLHQARNISKFDAEVDRRTESDKVYRVRENEKTPVTQCNIYSGKWVQDDSYPLYRAGECPYISADFDCKGNGRPDSGYTQWRWQPRDCNLPRLNATDMLQKLRGKKLVFAGDSLNRNQWESLICILRTVVPKNRKNFGAKGAMTTFLVKDYNCTIEFFWAPFLVEQGSINVGNNSKEIIRLDAIEKHGTHWKDVDILIFNSAHWWIRGNKDATKDLYKEGDYLHPQLDPLLAFEKGLTTWAKWIDQNINATKTRVLFRGFSPTHFSSEQWHMSGTHKCNFEREPILEDSLVRPYPVIPQVVEKVLGRMKFPVSLLNITRLSDFRKDAHPSVYTLRENKKLTQKQRNNPDLFGDCSHWCLPGLPDIWNELLYASLVTEVGGPFSTPRSDFQ